MKKEYLIAAFAAIAVVVAAFVYKFYFVAETGMPTGGVENKISLGPELLPQTSDEGSVEVSVAPIDFSPAAQSWDFQIALNTHSEELDADMAKISILVGDDEREYAPLVWDGALPGGHHREGILKFKPISGNLKSITLKIRGVGGIAERSFEWTLK